MQFEPPQGPFKWSVREALRQKWTLGECLYVTVVGSFLLLVGVAFAVYCAINLYAEIMYALGYGHTED